MGFPYHELVPPAILFRNPGITREEFIRILDRTRASYLHEYDCKGSWGRIKRRFLVPEHHKGLEGLASLLGLRNTEAFIDFQTPRSDENDLLLEPPILIPLSDEDAFFPTFRYEVWLHEKNLLQTRKRITEFSWGRLSVGDIWTECMMGAEKGIVRAIHKENKFRERKDEFDSGPEYEYTLDIEPIVPIGRKIVFKTAREVYQHYPLFNPKLKFDWNQESGSFSLLLCDDIFLWFNRGGRYYFDDKSFDRINDGFMGSGQFGYHDLILTAEAIKQKAWKLLSYRGLIHRDRFLQNFPDSRLVYELAIWNSQTSLYAKSKGMTHSEFLRYRHPNFL